MVVMRASFQTCRSSHLQSCTFGLASVQETSSPNEIDERLRPAPRTDAADLEESGGLVHVCYCYVYVRRQKCL